MAPDPYTPPTGQAGDSCSLLAGKPSINLAPSIRFSTTVASGSSPDTHSSRPDLDEEGFEHHKHTADEEALNLRKHTIEVQTRMRQRYRPYHRRIAPPPLELRFALKVAEDDTSYSDMKLEDVVEVCTLSSTRAHDCGIDSAVGPTHVPSRFIQISDRLVRSAYSAKLAAKKSIVHRISSAQANINALEKRNKFFRELQEEALQELDINEGDIEVIKGVMGARGIRDGEAEFHHTVYADDLVALTIAGMQPSHIMEATRRNNESISESSDSES
ncbi:hypothetical protein JVT61DRAFT_11871 [Boletus reticuloceps]|uniref:Uncharacterized protein n=1 Tax=Boletus reticuloceps TaxID=495285 RepID=A0A8I3ABM8_9AGAM|nr:hypothetical protein JVT61DRAFT_11871 [Boletus reticuloceps]